MKKKIYEARLKSRRKFISFDFLVFFSCPPFFSCFFFRSFLEFAHLFSVDEFIPRCPLFPHLFTSRASFTMRTPLTHTPDASPSHRRPALVASPIGRSTSLGARRRQRQRRQQQPQRHPRTPTFLAPVQALPTILAAGGQLRISTLGLGTWSWGNRFLYGYDPESQDQGIAEAFAAAAEAGVTLWDSADSYGTGALSGRAESLLGQFLCDRSLCSQAYRERQVVAATKIAPYPVRVDFDFFKF